jgi:serine protease Do
MEYDVAVLRVEGSEILKESCAEEAILGDSDKVILGEEVHIIGNAKAKGLSVTKGVISVVSEPLKMLGVDGKTNVTYTVMRTDAAINNGNSGGALYDSRGRLIGIPSAKTVDASVEGMGYALHINNVLAVADNILANDGTLKKATLGITMEVVGSKAVLDEDTGILDIVETLKITAKEEGKAGEVFKVGDQIVSIEINGKVIAVTKRQHYANAMLSARTGDTIKITVLRGGVEQTITIPLINESDFVVVR